MTILEQPKYQMDLALFSLYHFILLHSWSYQYLPMYFYQQELYVCMYMYKINCYIINFWIQKSERHHLPVQEASLKNSACHP